MNAPLSTPPDPVTPTADPFDGTAYRATGRLAAGATGTVFLVEHRKLGSEFAAKMLHPFLASEPRLVDRMRLEAQSLGRLRHPHIVSVVGFDVTSHGRPFIVLQRLRGQPLSVELAIRGPLPPLEAITYACQLLSALEAVHGIGIVHRDIKPDNLFICDRSDGRRFLKVLDFGVARVLPNAGEGAPLPLVLPTETGVIVGTPRFTSPEGALGQRVDARADVYAAALVLYTMLAGRGPFDHVSGDSNLLAAHAEDVPEPVSRHSPFAIPTAVAEAVERALRKDPAERFQSASDFCQALVEAAHDLGGPGIWSTTDMLQAEALQELETPGKLPTDIVGSSSDMTAFASLSSEPPSRSASRGMHRAAVWVAFFALLILTALGVALVVGRFRGEMVP